MKEPKIFSMEFGSVYPHYVTKTLKKGRTEEELLTLINWLTGYSKDEIYKCIENKLTFKDFFNKAPNMNDKRNLISGSICGVKIQEIEDPLMKKIRQMDKIVDDLAKGKTIEKIIR